MWESLVSLLFLVAVIAAYKLRAGRHALLIRPTLVLLAVVGIAVGIVRMVQYTPPPADAAFNGRYPMSVGFVLGQALANDIPLGGEVAVVDDRHQGGPYNFAQLHLEGLAQGSQGVNFTFSSVFTSELAATTGEQASAFPLPPIMAATRFVETFGNRRDLVAVVCFRGLPDGIDARAIRTLPPLYLANQSTFEWSNASLIQEPSVKAIATLKPDLPLRIRLPGKASLEEVFANRYELVR